MRNIYKLNVVLLFLFSSISVIAQKNFFTDVSETFLKANKEVQTIKPVKFRGVSLNKEAMRSFLWSLPSEKNVNNRKNTPILEIPLPDGKIGRFNVWESSIQEPGLEAKFPEIKTFAGQGIDDPYATIRFDYSPYLGFHAQILSDVTGRIYIDPYSRGDVNNYISYFHNDNKRDARFECLTPDSKDLQKTKSILAGPCRGTVLTTYRLAVTCTGEYAQTLSGVTVGSATPGLAGPTHAGVVASANRVSGLYEQDLAIRLVLVLNNNLVEFLDPSTDPFANDGSITELNLITGVINDLVGVANYDIGHQFCTNESGGVGAGVAGLSVVCTGNKGRGLTGRANPTGDGYDIDYVAHEMGHQFGALHTFNTAACFGGAGAGGSYEPGGGTTIMAYAGICAASENIQPNSDAIFHAKSFDDISNFLALGSGGSCGVTTPTGNILPIITSTPNNNISIPINTPFTLTATATDANGDALSYNWEGWDIGPAGTWPSAATSTDRPLFRTRVSKITGSRTFPDLRVIAANYPGTAAPSAMVGLRGEVLPQVARAMKFRLTVRDNRAGGGGVVSAGEGCQDATPFIVNAVGTAPFTVASPNGGESYSGGSSQTITWNVVETNAAPFNVTNVKISYSTDGGLTFPKVLALSTANDGKESVIIPVGPTTTGRVKVEAIGNIFFDISDANFSVNMGAIITTQPSSQTTCVSNAATFSVTASGTGLTYQWQKALAATPTVFTDIPGATNSSYTTTATGPTDNGNLYRVKIASIVSASTVTTSNIAMLTVINPVLITQNPVSQSGCVTDNYTFSVTATGGNLTYQWQVSTDGGITYNNVFPGTPSSPASSGTISNYTITNAQISLSGNFYRVVITGQPCGFIITPGVSLTLNKKLVIVLTEPATSNTNPAVNTMIFAIVSPANANILYSWKRNGVLIPNTLMSSSITIAVDDEAAYQVTITDISTGCQSTSDSINTLASRSDNLIANRVFIYPNPVKTMMQVRFNNSTSTNRGTMLNIYDEKGTRVLSKAYAIAGTFGRMDVDMTGMQNGTYMVYIMDNSGKKLGGSKVVKLN